MGFAGDYEKFRDRLGDVGLDEYSINSDTWSSERRQIHSGIGRLYDSFGYGNSSAPAHRESAKINMTKSKGTDHKRVVNQLLKHKNRLLFREKLLIDIIKQIDSPILIDKMKLYLEEIKEAVCNINDAVQKVKGESKFEVNRTYLSDKERVTERRALVKTIFESLVYYLSNANHDEKSIIRQLIADCYIIMKSENLLVKLDNAISINNKVRKYLLENAEIKETQDKCFFCKNNLLSAINYCINCYERKEE